MDFGVQLGDFRFPEGQFVELSIDVHHRVEHRFSLQRQVNGVFLLTVGVQFVFGDIKLAAHLRQLHFEELQALCRLFRFTRHVLRQVVAGDAVKDFANLVLIFPHHRQRQHAGVFTVFGNAQAVLQGIDHPQRRVFDDRKAGSFIGGNPCNHQRHAVFVDRLTHFAIDAETIIVTETEGGWTQHVQREGAVRHRRRALEGGDFDGLVLASHQAIPPSPQDREGVFANRNIEVQIVDGFAEHQT